MVVAEVTQPSLGVGYELGRAVALHKPVLCLFRPQSGRGEHPQPWAPFPALLGSGPPLLPWGGSELNAHPRKGWEGKGNGQCGRGGEYGSWGEPPSPTSSFPVLSAMIRGAADGSRFLVWDYEEAEVEALLDRYFESYPPEQVSASPDPTA